MLYVFLQSNQVQFAGKEQRSAVMINTTQKHLIPTAPGKSIMKTACAAQCQPKDFRPEESERTHNPSPDFSIQEES